MNTVGPSGRAEPAAPGPAQGAEHAERAASPVETSSAQPAWPRLLIVDDQPDIRKLICMTLEGEALELQEAANGEEALAKAHAWRPDVILLDVMMPGGLNGLEVCEAVRAAPELAHTRIILLSARADTADRVAGQRVGAHDYLTKPFRPSQLLDVIERLLAR